MFAIERIQVSTDDAGSRLTVCSRWFAGAMLAGGVLGFSAWLSEPASAQSAGQDVQEMTEDLAKAVGPNVASVVAVDEQGNEVVYVRSDIYEEGLAIDFNTQVSFPLDVTKIRKVKYLGGSNNIVRIDYSTNPDKSMECKWVGTIYRCYSS